MSDPRIESLGPPSPPRPALSTPASFDTKDVLMETPAVMVMVMALAGGLNTNCRRAATEKCRNLIHLEDSWRRRMMVLLQHTRLPLAL